MTNRRPDSRWNKWFNVALGLIRDRRNRLLLVKREGAEYSGFWGLPGGKFQFSEIGEETIIREIREETSLIQTDYSAPVFVGLGLERLEQFVRQPAPGYRLKARWQLYYYAAQLVVEKEATPECRWFSDDELLAEPDVIPSVLRVVEIDRERSQGRFDFFFMEDTIRKKRHQLALTNIRVDRFRRQTSVEGP